MPTRGDWSDPGCSGEAIISTSTISAPQVGDDHRPAHSTRPSAAWWAAWWRRSSWLVPLRVKLGILLGTVAALAVAIPTIIHSILLVGVVEVSLPVDEVNALLSSQLARTGLPALVAFVLATLLGIALAGRVTDPLMIVLHALRSLRNDEPGPRLPRSR